MSDANKWPIKDKEVVEGNNNMLNKEEAEDNGRGHISAGDGPTTTSTPSAAVVKEENRTTTNDPPEVVGEVKRAVDDHNDNNCGHGDSLSPVPLRLILAELRETDKDVTGVATVATNEVEGVLANDGDNRASTLLAAVRTPPFPMPSPSAKPRTPGILRLDTSGKKSRRSSGISSTVEFRNDPEMLGESTPTSSNPISPQLSVTWAFQRDSRGSGSTGADHVDSTTRHRSVEDESVQLQPPQARSSTKFREVLGRRIRAKFKREDTQCAPVKSQRKRPDPLSFMETSKYNSLDAAGPADSEDEDYSQSVSAIMQRRASTHRGRSRRGKSPRRSSSPLAAVIAPNHNAHYMNNSHATMNNNGDGGGGTGGGGNGGGGDRRRSSVYTTSSGETAISFEDDGNNQGSSKEQIVENIRLHKEVLQSVKFQSWSMRRKMRLVRQAKAYVARHEGALQERYAQSRNTRDLWARFKLLVAAKMQHIRRELTNFSTQLIPWESRIKEIESHFGSVVASYFTFLRWLLWVNIVIAFIFAMFVVVPEVVASDLKEGPGFKKLLPVEVESAGYLGTAVAFEGYLKYSALFYGYYSNLSEAALGYKLPLAYFLTGLAIYIYSFIATLRKMAKNSRMSKLSSKDDECIFSWKLFTGWDFLIGHAETAHNRIASVVLSFKEALLEEAEKKKNKGWKIIGIRIIVNVIVLALLCASAYAVIIVVERSTEIDRRTWLRENEITICITFISHVFPIMFDILGCFESYHPRKQLRLQLARIMFLNLLTLYALIFAQFVKIDSMNKESEVLRQYLSYAEVINGSIPYPPTKDTTTPIPYELFSQQYLAPFNRDEEFTTLASVLPMKDMFEVDGSPLALLDGRRSSMMRAWKDVSETTTPVTTTMSDEWNSVTSESCVRIVVECPRSTSMAPYATDSSNFTAVTTMTTLLAILTTLSAQFTTEGGVTLGLDGVSNDTQESPYSNATDMSFDFEFPNTTGLFENETLTTRKYFGQTTTEDPEDDFYYDTTIAESILFDDEGSVPEDFKSTIARFRRALEDGSFNSSMADNETTLEDMLDMIRENLTMLWDNSTLGSNETMWNFTELLSDVFQFANISTTTELPLEGEDEVEDSMSTTPGEELCYEYVCPNVTDAGIITEDEYVTTTEHGSTTVEEEELKLGTTTTTYTEPPPPSTTTTTERMTTTTDKFVPTEGTSSIPFNPPPPTPKRRNRPRINITDIEALQRQSKYLPMGVQQRIRNLCWETMFGREILKLNVMDILLFVLSVFCMDFMRALFVRFMNKCWCWDLEKKFPRYNDFKIAENILHLINNQGMVWMGMFFSPGLAIINMVKLIIILYLRSWAVLTCNVPHSVVFRASRSNNFYLGLLLTMLFLCVLPVAYMIVWIEPSWHCGPFSQQKRISVILTDTIRKFLPKEFHFALDRFASSSTVIPMLVLLILIIYYLVSLTSALREANEDLRNQLRRERMEERRKMLKLNEQKQNPQENAPISLRWRKVLDSASSPLTPTAAGGVVDELEAQKIQEKKERLQRIMKKALRKGSATSDEESVVGIPHHPHHHRNNNNNTNHGHEDENTDTEQHESLPHDQEDEDNKINIQKQSGGEKKRDLFPELIKKLRESAKKNPKEVVIDVQPKKAPSATESTDDDERVVRERRKSLLRRGMKNEGESAAPVETKFDVIDETSGSGGGGGNSGCNSDTEKVPADKPTKKSKVKASVFTFDVPPTPEVNSSSDNDAAGGGGKASVSPKSPIYATVNKARKSPTAEQSDDSIKGKFNSFFTIVREAVHARRQSLIAEQLDSEAVSPAAIRTAKPPISKRDSDCSIWSDNIPVITISKTGSDECILEEDKKGSSSAPSSDGEQLPPPPVGVAQEDTFRDTVVEEEVLPDPPKSL